jgi:hypothetical protein
VLAELPTKTLVGWRVQRVTGAVREESRQEFHDAGDLHPDWEDIPPPPPPDEREQEEQQPVQQPAQVPLHSASNHAGEKTYHVVEGCVRCHWLGMFFSLRVEVLVWER